MMTLEAFWKRGAQRASALQLKTPPISALAGCSKTWDSWRSGRHYSSND